MTGFVIALLIWVLVLGLLMAIVGLLVAILMSLRTLVRQTLSLPPRPPKFEKP